MSSLAVLVAVLTVGASVVDQPRSAIDYMRVYEACLKEQGRVNNGSVGLCAEDAADQAQLEIAALQQQIQSSLLAESPAEAGKLERAQDGWVVYRDNHCELAGAHIGGPMYAYCPLQLNIKRVEELRELVEARATYDQYSAVPGR